MGDLKMADIWVGVEKEGMFKDINTLFIATKDITYKEVFNILKNYNINNIKNQIDQIYFGAGCCKPFNEKVIIKCLQEHKDIDITVEIKLSNIKKYHKKKWFKECNIIVSHDNSLYENISKLKNKGIVQIKLQSIKSNQPMLCTLDLKDLIWTDMKTFDKKEMYKNDFIIK